MPIKHYFDGLIINFKFRAKQSDKVMESNSYVYSLIRMKIISPYILLTVH